MYPYTSMVLACFLCEWGNVPESGAAISLIKVHTLTRDRFHDLPGHLTFGKASPGKSTLHPTLAIGLH